MALFPSKEWAEELYNRVNADEEYGRAASDWEGTFTLLVKEEEDKLEKPFILWLDPWHGKVRGFEILKDIDEKKSDFILEGDYSVWKGVLQGKKDATKQMMAGKLKLKGSMTYILKRAKASNALTKILTKIPTEFIDETD